MVEFLTRFDSEVGCMMLYGEFTIVSVLMFKDSGDDGLVIYVFAIINKASSAVFQGHIVISYYKVKVVLPHILSKSVIVMNFKVIFPCGNAWMCWIDC